MSLIPEIKLGDWYFVVTCDLCQRQAVVGSAPSPTESSLVYAWPAETHCDCGKHNHFQPEQILKMQAQADSKLESNVVFRLP